MIEIIMIVAAGLLVLPVLFFLPTAVSIKSKMIMLAVSLVLAGAGLFALDLFSYWSAALAIVGLAFITAYLAEKRMPAAAESYGPGDSHPASGEWDDSYYDFRENVLADESMDLVGEEQSEENELPVEAENPVAEAAELIDIELPASAAEEVSDEDMRAAESVEKPEYEAAELEEIGAVIAETQQEPEETVQPVEMENILPDESSPEMTAQSVTADMLEDDIESLLENRDHLQLSDTTAEPSFDELAEKRNWLDELEELEVQVSMQEPVEEEAETDTRDVAESIEELIELEELPGEIEAIQSAECEQAEELILSAEEIEALQLIETAPVLEEDFLLAASEEHDVEPNIDDIAEFDLIEDSEAASFIEEHIQPDMDSTMRDMLLETIGHYEKQGDMDSQREMLRSILAQPLSDMDYYIFSKQLAESCLGHEDFRGAEAILEEMSVRLSDYIIIQEEINDYFSILHSKKSIVQ